MLKIILLVTLFSSVAVSVQAKSSRCHKNKKHQVVCLRQITTYDKYFLYRHGLYKKFYKSKVVYETGHYKNDNKSGEWKVFHSNGKIKLRSFFYKGFHYGSKEKYNRKGELLSRSLYPSLKELKSKYSWPNARQKEELRSTLKSLIIKTNPKLKSLEIISAIKKRYIELKIVTNIGNKKEFSYLNMQKNEQGWKVW